MSSYCLNRENYCCTGRSRSFDRGLAHPLPNKKALFKATTFISDFKNFTFLNAPRKFINAPFKILKVGTFDEHQKSIYHHISNCLESELQIACGKAIAQSDDPAVFFDVTLQNGIRFTLCQYVDSVDKGAYLNIWHRDEFITQGYLKVDQLISALKKSDE